MNSVAIIIANYNYGDYVQKAIESALNQTYKCHVIVVNDGSTDDSLQTILSMIDYTSKTYSILNEEYYSGPIEIYSGENITLININNSGASTARNVGMHYASTFADFFAILDADDSYELNRVEVLLKKMLEYDEIGVVYSDYEINHFNYDKIELKQPYSRFALERECIVHSAALIRKKNLVEVMLPNKEFYDSKLHGPLSQGFIGCTEDYDLWLRLSNVCMIVHVPQILATANEHGRNQSLNMNSQIFMNNVRTIQNR